MDILGTTVTYAIGDAVTRGGAVIGHIVREATEDEFMATHPGFADGLHKYLSRLFRTAM